ncbi:hypothetical protein PNEG_01948 [Pneumocystis murina B123]|uniref:DNA endonuclease activator Ctp1 C-terminal domain-containing protein n=1 Tax=Pneumocystis murina (strain B123) TaxID=1069680 RepID=M7PH51_PNEMU|nr:hypothetical protein PNEG_01948 [Pneumocystis murina B123]EMR09764.1 hypothetical protein PNEG_01948 [Pneumocystis murina B123]
MDERDIIRDFSKEIDNFKKNLLNITFDYTNLQSKKLEKFSKYCRKYQETIDYQNRIIQSLVEEKNKEIQTIHEHKNHLKKDKHQDLLLDYSNYIKSFCKKNSEYDALLFFLERYEKMKDSLLYLSKKYRKDKKMWKEYINYYEIDKKSKDFGLFKDRCNLKEKGNLEESNVSDSLSINKINSNKLKANSETLESLVLTNSLKPNMSPSSSILSECLDKYIFDNQKDACHITEYLYNDSTTEDENEAIKPCFDDSNIKKSFKNSKINEEEESILFKSVISDNNTEIVNYNLGDIRKSENSSLKSFPTKNIEGFHDIAKNPQIMTPESKLVEQNTTLNISNFLPTPKPDSKSIYLKTQSFNKQRDSNKENISKISTDFGMSHTFSTFSNVQSLVSETKHIQKTNKESASNIDLSSILSKKKNDILIIDSFSEKEIIKNTFVTEKSNSDKNTNLKRGISPQNDENNKLDKKNEFTFNFNFNNKKLGRYAKKSKSTEESLNDYVIDLNKNDKIPYAYDEVVRDKASRRHLPACACDNCIKFFEAHGPIATIFKPKWRSPLKKKTYTDSDKEHIYRNLQEVSRHRSAFFRPKTPPGFWESDFPSTQQEEIYRKQAQVQNYERLKKRQLEAERGGRWKKKV